MKKRRLRKPTGVVPRLGQAIGTWLGRVVGRPQLWVALAVIAGAIIGLPQVARHSEAFGIQRIVLPPGSTLQVPASLIGQNLWTVDLQRVADQLKSQQPQLKRVRVIRQMPNTLSIEVSQRLPVGQLRLATGRWHPVDLDSFVLSDGRPSPWEHLVVMKGIDQGRPAVKVGVENTNERLLEAVGMVAWLRRSPALIGHQLTAIDVADLRHVTLVLEDDVEIRCGSARQLTEQMGRVRSVFKNMAKQPVEVQYIDVRFPEPVIGQRLSASAARTGHSRLQ